MRDRNGLKWKRIALAIICLGGLLAIIGGSYAAYTSQAFKRGVVRNRDNEVVRFSSNYLELYANTVTTYIEKKISVADRIETGKEYSMDLTVANYVNGNSSLFNLKDITYTLIITASGDGASGCKVTYGDTTKSISDGEIKFENQKLIGRAAADYSYTITVPAEAVDKVKITAKAVPTTTSSVVTKNQILAAVLVPCTGDAISTFRYEGRFTDADASGTVPSEYNGFNYEVSISSGTATGTLTWDSSILEIDKYFLQKINKIPTEENDKNKKKVEFDMDLLNGTGDYLIPFYIKNKTEIDKKTWEQMNELVTFTAEQSENELSR